MNLTGKKIKTALGAATLAIVMAVGGVSFDSPSANASDFGELILKRQKGMKGMGGGMKKIGAFLKKDEGSAADVAAIAMKFSKIGPNIPKAYPKGSSLEDILDPQTGAKPDIWMNMDKFQMAGETMADYAMKLNAAALTGDKDAIASAFSDLGKKGCGGCHKPFREKIER